MAIYIYALCAIASGFCALLLYRQYKATAHTLLLHSTIAFSAFTLNNLLLFIDLGLWANGPDLSILRSSFSVVGATFLLYGLIRETT